MSIICLLCPWFYVAFLKYQTPILITLEKSLFFFTSAIRHCKSVFDLLPLVMHVFYAKSMSNCQPMFLTARRHLVETAFEMVSIEQDVLFLRVQFGKRAKKKL